MAFLDKSKANYAFKALNGKAHTSNGRELSNESIASGVTLSASRIFADAINSNPADSSNSGIVSAQITLVLEAIAGSDTFTLGEYQGYRAKLGASVPASLVGITNPITGSPYAANDYVGSIIPQSFGDNFRPILYSDAAATIEIPPSSAADWFIDCFAGIIVQEGSEDGGTPFILGANGRLKAYIYTGRSVKDALTSGGGGGGGGSSEWLDSAKGFSQDLIGGTNAFFNFYDDTALTNHIDQSLLVNGLRWIHIGSTVSGLNIYNPTTNTFTTGSISNNDVVQYYVSMGTSGTIGYEKTTPSLGTNIVFDADNTTIFRFTGSTWVPTANTTASNGLTKVGADVQLGGLLTQITSIDGNNAYALNIVQLDNAQLYANNGIQIQNNTSGNLQLGNYGSGSTQMFTGSSTDQLYIQHGGTGSMEVQNIGASEFRIQNDGAGDASSSGANGLIIQNDAGGSDLSIVSNAQSLKLTNNGAGAFDITNNSSGGGMIIADNSSFGITVNSTDTFTVNSLNANINTSGAINLVTSTPNFGTITINSPGTVNLQGDTHLNLKASGDMIISSPTGSATFAGAQYSQDFSTNFTPRSLVDAEWVYNSIASAGTAGASAITASNGLTKNGEDIELGGDLTQDTTIGGPSSSAYNLHIGDPSGLQSFTVTTVANSSLYSSGGNIDLTTGSGTIQIAANGSGFVEIDLSASATGFTIQDGRSGGNQTGIEYAGDYSANYTSRSLIDKGYLVSVTGGSPVTASNGLNKVGQNVQLGGNLITPTTVTLQGNDLTFSQGTAGGSTLKYAGDYSADYTIRSLVDKGYVDALLQGLDLKASVKATTTGTNITLSGAQTIDGVSIIAGDRVLVKDQTIASQNGIYVASAGAWTIAPDFVQGDVKSGAFTFVELGTLYAGTGWVLTTPDPITVGVTSLTFVQFSAAGVISASNGLTQTGQSIVLGGTLTSDITFTGSPFNFNVGDPSGLNAINLRANTGIALYTANNPIDLTAGNGAINMSGNSGSNFVTMNMDSSSSTGFYIQDGRTGSNQVGLVYSGDYSAHYTNRSLVDKQFVVNQVYQAGTAGAVTVSNGLTDVNNHITLGGTLTQDTTIDTASNSFVVTSDATTNRVDYFFVTNSANTNAPSAYIDASYAVAASPLTSVSMLAYNNLFGSGFYASADDTGVVTVDNNYASMYYSNGGLYNEVVTDAHGFYLQTNSNNIIAADNAGHLNVTATTFTLTNSLSSSTSGYDIVVRDQSSGILNKISSSVLTGSVPTLADKNLTPSAGTNGTSGYGNATGLTITYPPSAHGYVEVTVNGIMAVLGTGLGIGECYFAVPGSGGTIGRATNAIQAGDQFFWNEVNAGYYLDANDSVSFLYSV